MSTATDPRRRALRVLADSPTGRQEWFLRAHGFSSELIIDLIEGGLATMQPEHLMTTGREIEVRRIRITDAGRALADRKR